MSAINLDAVGNPIIVGSTSSGFNNTYNIPFPTDNPPQAFVQSQNNGDSQLRSDMFIAHFDNNQNLKWVTYWGGDKDETGLCATVANNNRMYVGGSTATMNIVGQTTNFLPLEDFDLGNEFDWDQSIPEGSQGNVWSYGARFNLDLVYTVDVSELQNSPTLLIYPNPSQSIVSIVGLNNQKIDYNIYDNLGNVVAVEKNKVASNINIESLASGIYQILLTIEDQSYTIKFLKQ